MTCNHDPLYRKQNEQCGGVGCPICNSQRKRQYIDSARDVTPVKTIADKIVNACDDWTCNFCGIAQPAWAGDCLTCETVPMMGDRD